MSIILNIHDSQRSSVKVKGKITQLRAFMRIKWLAGGHPNNRASCPAADL